MAQPARLLISVDASQPGNVARVADALRSAGVTVHGVLEELGTITAECAPEKVAELSRIGGVVHVEAERTVSVPSPGSKVQ